MNLTQQIDEAEKNRFLDEVMAHIIIAGGVAFAHSQLRDMRLGTLLDLIWPNKIRLRVTTQEKRQL